MYIPQNFMKIEGNILKRLIKRISLILAFTIITLFCIIFCIFPFDLFQIYCYKLFCTDFMSNIPYHVETFGIENNLVMFGKFSKYNQSWCNDKLPLAYSYVQNKYWNVGFLKYYQLKQIPNFLLAAPILGIFFSIVGASNQKLAKTFLQIFNFNTVHVKANLIFENPLLLYM
ncbi:hypothetical protein HHI36_004208 [Cryptolaemus montrouzieri]|uniref:GPI mannosyltransferase 2 n=1 Tax=Cryptolaemus montrouzieri TaxID=559131 RepID=A0ABD2NQI1_9CUCU